MPFPLTSLAGKNVFHPTYQNLSLVDPIVFILCNQRAFQPKYRRSFNPFAVLPKEPPFRFVRALLQTILLHFFSLMLRCVKVSQRFLNRQRFRLNLLDQTMLQPQDTVTASSE